MLTLFPRFDCACVCAQCPQACVAVYDGHGGVQVRLSPCCCCCCCCCSLFAKFVAFNRSASCALLLFAQAAEWCESHLHFNIAKSATVGDGDLSDAIRSGYARESDGLCCGLPLLPAVALGWFFASAARC